MSTTSGITSFSMDIDDIIEDAKDKIGGEYSTGIEMSKARRTLNLILIKLQNKEIPLNKLDFVTLPLTQGVDTYTLDASILDILTATMSYNADTETQITRKGLKEYLTMPTKNQQGRPNMFVTDRKADAVRVTFWPVSDKPGYEAKFLVSKKIESVTASFQKLNLAERYLPLIISWLAYDLSLSKPNVPQDIRDRLKMEYMEQMADAFVEDRERADFIMTPGGISGR